MFSSTTAFLAGTLVASFMLCFILADWARLTDWVAQHLGAVTILVVVLVAQYVVQALVQAKLTEGRASLHPIVIFGSTVAGGATFGLLGAALSTPVVAIAVRVGARLRDGDMPRAADAALDR